MKRYFFILAFMFCLNISAQAPQGFNYQATVRNSAGDLIINQNVYFKFNIIQGSPTSLPVFTEIHYVPTDDLGQVTLVIGQGTSTTGIFSDINWSLGDYYFGIELNTGNGYTAMGTTKMLSVPYALYAENTSNSTVAIPKLEDVLSTNNSANYQQIKNLKKPTEIGDATNKFYVDSLTTNNKIMKFNGWESNQIWNDNTTFQLESNSFVLVQATNTTLILPDYTESKIGDVVYVYYMPTELFLGSLTLQVNNLPITYFQNSDNKYTSLFSGTVVGDFERGLNTIVRIGDYWMCGGFLSATEDPLPGIAGTWRLAPEAGSLAVGPNLLDGSGAPWWSIPEEDVVTRACIYDDEYVFNNDGTFQNVLQGETWNEPVNDTDCYGTTDLEADCGTPAFPFDGSASATYSYDETAETITITGKGAFLGLARVINGAEICPADAADSIEYIAKLDGNVLEIFIQTDVANNAYWYYKLVKQ